MGKMAQIFLSQRKGTQITQMVRKREKLYAITACIYCVRWHMRMLHLRNKNIHLIPVIAMKYALVNRIRSPVLKVPSKEKLAEIFRLNSEWSSFWGI